MSGKRQPMARIVVIFCITALTSFAGSAFAQDGCNGGDFGGNHSGKHSQHSQHSFHRLAKKLGLSETQKTEAKSIFDANKLVVKPIIDSMHSERKNLQTLMHADTIDAAAIRAETAKTALIQADLNVNRASVNAQFRAILTPDQLTTLKTMKQKHHRKDAAPAVTTTTTN